MTNKPRNQSDNTGQTKRILGRIAIGAGSAIAAGLFAFWLKERTQEEAKYTVLESEGPFSLRRYGPLVVTKVKAEGTIATAAAAGHSLLRPYLKGRSGRDTNENTLSIPMAGPTTLIPAEHPGSWDVRFTMPKGYFRSTLPHPTDDITITEIPGRLIAAIKFSGATQDSNAIAAKHTELVNWVQSHGFVPDGEAEFATYNSPVMPGLVRRNEWWIPVQEPQNT